MANEPEVDVADPWLNDDDFTQLDTRKGTLADELANIANAEPELIPEVVTNVEPVQEVNEPAPAPAPAPEPPQPEVTNFADGSSLTLEKTSKGWKATCESGIQGVNAEVFYGRTKDELLQNIAAGKINSTKKIRELNRAAKIAKVMNIDPAPQAPAQKASLKPRALTADEKFEIKNLFASDPAEAFELFVKKTTGGTWEQMQEMVQKGNDVSTDKITGDIAEQFVESHPEYVASSDNINAIMSFMSKTYLRQKYDPQTYTATLEDLYAGGFWSVKNLEFAFEELTEAGLLELAEVESPEQTTEEVEVEEAPAPPPPPPQPAPSPRIANERRRPRAGYGIRQSEASGVAKPETTTPPSDEDLNNLSDSDIQKLFADVRRAAAQGRR